MLNRINSKMALSDIAFRNAKPGDKSYPLNLYGYDACDLTQQLRFWVLSGFVIGGGNSNRDINLVLHNNLGWSFKWSLGGHHNI